MRVLIADDDEALLELLRALLWDRGHEVKTAADGLECIVELAKFTPDVLVIDRDLRWGGCDGLVEYCRDEPRLANACVIVTEDGRLPRLENLDAVCLRKPFGVSDLLACINDLTRSRAASTRLVALPQGRPAQTVA
jgi:DNA-binding response OmpR family regulator